MAEQTEMPVADSKADLPPAAKLGKSQLLKKLITLAIIIIPFAGAIAAPFFAWGWGFGWTDLVLLVAMYLVTALGITVGYHRLFVHRSFETYTWNKFLWAIFGSMAVQGSLFNWVGLHRKHHQHSDTPDDPHTPHHHREGILGLLEGFWHAHLGWFFKPSPPDLDRYIKDVSSSPPLRIASQLFPLWVALGLLVPAILGGLFTLSWQGVLTGLIWGGLVRIFLVHHVTWSVNSACHLWGLRPYKSDDESRNNFLFGILALGEGWHNTHHAFPSSARHGLRFWQIDVSYWVIRTMELLGLAWNVKLPSSELQASSRR